MEDRIGGTRNFELRVTGYMERTAEYPISNIQCRSEESLARYLFL
jgi:hypothetical protein